MSTIKLNYLKSLTSRLFVIFRLCGFPVLINDFLKATFKKQTLIKMSLADELLADLEGNDEEDDLENMIESSETAENNLDKNNLNEEPMEIDTIQINSVRELCKLRDSDHLANIMKEIQTYMKKIRKPSDIIGPVESDPEYQLIVEANNTAADIDSEIGNFVYKIVI